MISIPTAILTPRGGLSGAGKPATPAVPNNQSGIAAPACLTSGVNNSGRSFSSILFLSPCRIITHTRRDGSGFTQVGLLSCRLGSPFVPVGAGVDDAWGGDACVAL